MHGMLCPRDITSDRKTQPKFSGTERRLISSSRHAGIVNTRKQNGMSLLFVHTEIVSELANCKCLEDDFEDSLSVRDSTAHIGH